MRTPAERSSGARCAKRSRPHAFAARCRSARIYADFCAHGARLIVELDGGQHAEAVEYDAARTAFLNAKAIACSASGTTT